MKKISQKIIKLLIKKKINVSFAESCTGGLLSSSITSISGSSKVFTLGLVTYSMVKNLNKISKTHISVSITGIAGPKGGTKQKPVGLVFIGIKKGSKTLVQKYLFKNKKRLSIQKASVNKALNLILSFAK